MLVTVTGGLVWGAGRKQCCLIFHLFLVWPENEGSWLIFLMHQHHPCFSVEFSRELPPLTTDGLKATQTTLQACLTMVPFIGEKKIHFQLYQLFKNKQRGLWSPFGATVVSLGCGCTSWSWENSPETPTVRCWESVRMCVWLRQSICQND